MALFISQFVFFDFVTCVHKRASIIRIVLVVIHVVLIGCDTELLLLVIFFVIMIVMVTIVVAMTSVTVPVVIMVLLMV